MAKLNIIPAVLLESFKVFLRDGRILAILSPQDSRNTLRGVDLGNYELVTFNVSDILEIWLTDEIDGSCESLIYEGGTT